MAFDGTLKFDTSLDTDGFQKGTNNVGSIVKGMAAFRLLEKGFNAVVGSIDAAIVRYDKLNNFPRVLEQMGFSADDSARATERLVDGIEGLPTALDDVTGTAQAFAIMTGDLDLATDTTIALNNAFLASGGGAHAAARGMYHYKNMMATGEVDMRRWNGLVETMGPSLNRVAEAFGFAGASAKMDLFSALQSGEITFEQFNAKIIQLNDGVGGFAELALTASAGIGTAWTRLRIAMVRGTTGIITAIDQGLSSTRFGSIENIIDSMRIAVDRSLRLVAAAFGLLARNISIVIPVVAAFVTAIKTIKLLALIGKLGSLKAALLSLVPEKYKLIAATAKSTKANLKNAAALIKESLSKKINTAATLKETLATKASYAATTKKIAAKKASTAVTLKSAIVLAGYAGIQFVATTAIKAATVATWLFNKALYANPIILIVMAIAALIAGLIVLIAVLARIGRAYREERDAIRDLAEAHEEYRNSLNQANEAAQNATNERKAQMDANRDLISSLHDLIAANDEYGKNNGLIAANVNNLNNELQGLGLAFDETTGTLNMTNDELQAYLDNLSKVENFQALQSEHNRLLTEENNIRQKITEQQNEQGRFRKMLDEGVIRRRQYNRLIAESDELLAEYNATLAEVEAQAIETGIAAAEAFDEGAEAAVRAQQRINEITTHQMDDVRRLAKQYRVSMDDIIQAASEMEGGLEQWASEQERIFTRSGMDLGMLADRWGMAADAVKGYMDEWGMSAQDFHEYMTSIHTKEGYNLEQLAAKWGTTTEAIERELAMQEISLQEWSDNQSATLTKEGLNIEQLAVKWGTTTEAIQEELLSQGISIQEWSDNQTAALEEFNAKVAEHTSAVVNSFKKIPYEYEMSAEEMLAVLAHNRERYAEWRQAMVEISGEVSAESLAELERLGPGALSAINEMRDNGGEGLREFDALMTGIISDSTDYVLAELGNPALPEAAGQLPTAMGEAITSNPAMAEAATQLVEDTRSQFDSQVAAADFSGIGAAIVDEIIDGAMKSDASGIMTHIANSMNAGRRKVVSSVRSMSTTVQNLFRSKQTSVQNTVRNMTTNVNSTLNTLRTRSTTTTNQMMNSMVSTINNGSSRARSTVASMASGIVSSLGLMVSGAINTTHQMMNGISAVMSSRAGALNAQARSIANGIAATMRSAMQVRSPSRVMIAIFEDVLMGAYVGMANMKHMLFRQAKSIADNIADYMCFDAGEIDIGFDVDSLIEKLSDLDLDKLLSKTYAVIDNLHLDITHKVHLLESPRVEKSNEADQKSNVLQGLIKKLDAIAKRPIVAVLNLDGEELARVTVDPLTEEIARRDTLKKMLGGVRT